MPISQARSLRVERQTKPLYAPAGGEENAERKEFVERETIAKVLANCPDTEWRLIVALSRFGGLRVPSELLALEWSHIDWERGRFTVTSRKMKRHNKPYRVVPIFPELLPYLQEAFENAPDGARYVIARYRQKNANLRTQLNRILRRAGVEPWQRLFHNLRASRQTELQNQFPAHVVCDWLGNSEAIAHKHYLTVTDEHFDQATGGSQGAQVGHIVGQQPSATNCCKSKKPQDLTAFCLFFPRLLILPKHPLGESHYPIKARRKW